LEKLIICPVCENGELLSRISYNAVKYRGEEVEIPVYYSECNSCGSEVATSKQTRVNKRLMLEFKESVDSSLIIKGEIK